jgi:UDP-glucose 6-dehydrogenase
MLAAKISFMNELAKLAEALLDYCFAGLWLQ